MVKPTDIRSMPRIPIFWNDVWGAMASISGGNKSDVRFVAPVRSSTVIYRRC
jgi:hypothetical protein